MGPKANAAHLGENCPNGALTDLIRRRVSSPRLAEPVPEPATLERIFQCALRAPDHHALRSSRYLVIQGDARAKLGALFCQAVGADEPTLTEQQQEKYRAMPLRAPMIIVGISANKVEPKVPVQEQILSCGVGLGYLLLALNAEGFGGIWRTGFLASHPLVKAGLGIGAEETLVGFLYVGTPKDEAKPAPDLKVEDYFQTWG